MIRRLGGKRWQALHRLVYVAAITGVIHYWWLVKSDIRPPLRYAIIVGILLGARMIRASLRARHVTGPRVPARRRRRRHAESAVTCSVRVFTSVLRSSSSGSVRDAPNSNTEREREPSTEPEHEPRREREA